MLERLEDIHPRALEFFLDEAKKRGIYQSAKNSPRQIMTQGAK